MFPSKKALAAGFSFLFFTQQFVSALPITGALQRDAQRFHKKAVAEESETALPAESYKKLEDFNKRTKSSWQIRMNRKSGAPRALVNGENIRVGKSDSSALSFLGKNKDFLGVDRKQLKLKLQRKSPIGAHYFFDQYYKDVKVENAYVKVNVDNSGNLLNYQSTYIKDLNVDLTPKKTALEAGAIAAADAAGGSVTSAAEKVIYTDPNTDEPVLAWKLKVQGGASEPGKWTYYINADNGLIINRISNLMYAPETFIAKLNPVYPGFADAADDTTLYLGDLDVYYYTSSASTYPAKATTAANGVASLSARTGRLFSLFSNQYFTITNQNNPPLSSGGYYLEKGLNGSNLQETITPQWEKSSIINNPYTGYAACSTSGYGPAFTAPIVEADMNVGYMDAAGYIVNKAFLQFYDGSTPSYVYAKYIGQPGQALLGPLVPLTSSSVSVGFGLTPAGSSGKYTITEAGRFCVPKGLTSGYSPLTTHTMAIHTVNDVEANTYYNLNTMRNFFSTLNTGNYVNLNKHLPVVVNAHGLSLANSNGNGMTNAFYDLDEKILMFGQGLRVYASSVYKNFALESAIVRHEYVHFVMDNIWPIVYTGEGAAISEAVADYFALSSLTPSGNTTPYTSTIGSYVAVDTQSGEGVARNLVGDTEFDPSIWVENAITSHHKNSLVLSQALWKLRTAVGYKLADGHTDKLVWTALMFYPDSLLEFRDAMIASAKALGWTADVSKIESAFNAHKIDYDTIITANGDIYEPNNSPDSAADIDIASISSKKLTASINPVSDMDYYSISLPEGEFEVTITLPAVPNQQGAYYPLSMVLLDANTKTVVDTVSPTLDNGQYKQMTKDSKVTLKYTVPSLLSASTGRFILGIFKPDNAAYPAVITNTTGIYSLEFKFSKGSNVGGVTTIVNGDFTDGLYMDFNVPYNTNNLEQSASGTPSSLADWIPTKIESFNSVRLLDEKLNVINNTTATVAAPATYLKVSNIAYNAGTKKLSGRVTFQGGFSSLDHRIIYLQVFGKIRSNASQNPGGNYRDDYGIVSLGISEPLRNTVRTGPDNYLTNSIFNPMKGTKLRLELNAKSDGHMKAQIFTIDGLLVKTLWDGQMSTIMPEYVEWDGRNDKGNMVASGVYLLRIDGAGVDKELKKIVVVK